MKKKPICPKCGRQCVEITRYANGSILTTHGSRPVFGGLMLEITDGCLIPSPYEAKERKARERAQTIKSIGYVNARDMKREDLYWELFQAGYVWSEKIQEWNRLLEAKSAHKSNR